MSNMTTNDLTFLIIRTIDVTTQGNDKKSYLITITILYLIPVVASDYPVYSRVLLLVALVVITNIFYTTSPCSDVEGSI